MRDDRYTTPWDEDAPPIASTPSPSRSRRRPAGPEPAVNPTIAEALTDSSHAQLFAETYGLQLRLNYRRGLWLVYEAPRWRVDSDGQVYRLALEFVRGRQTSALDIADRKWKERILKFVIAAESKPSLDRLIAGAKNFHPIADAGDGWDADPWLTGTSSGVLDWRTGRLRPGDPADQITKCLGVPFIAAAGAPRWERFIAEVFDGDAELIGFIHRYLG